MTAKLPRDASLASSGARRLAVPLLTLGLLGCSSAETPTPPGPTPPVETTARWVDRGEKAGLSGLPSDHCRFVSTADLDGDGAPDLIVPRENVGFELYRNDGGHFSLVKTLELEAADAAQLGICAHTVGDLDGDGLLDLVLPLASGNRVVIFFNDGGWSFSRTGAGALDPADEHVPSSVAVLAGKGVYPILLVGRDVIGGIPSLDESICAFDARGINMECHTEVKKASNVAYNVHSRAITLFAGLPTLAGHTLAMGALDLDGDGLDDVIGAVDFASQIALHRKGQALVDESAERGVGGVFGHGMGIAIADFDHDGVEDYVATTLGGVLDFAQVSKGVFSFRGDQSKLMTRQRKIWPWGLLAEDFNNDGLSDLLVLNQFSELAEDGNGEGPLRWIGRLGGPDDFLNSFHTLFVQQADSSFQERSLFASALPPGHTGALSASVADIDGDGRPEVFLPAFTKADRERVDLLVGNLDLGALGHGLTVRFSRPRSGLSAELACGGRTRTQWLHGAEGYGTAPRMELHFGCGESTTYASLVVRDRGKVVASLPGGALDQAILVKVP